MASQSENVFVIAEAGVNHNGSLDLAYELVDVACDARADAIKFQSFRSEQLVSRAARKAAYQERATGDAEGQLEMLKRLELTPTQQQALARRCSERGILFMSTPFDLESLAELIALDVTTIKISSGDVTYAPLLRAIGRSGRPSILSTGMSSLADVEAALGFLASGYLEADGRVAAPSAALRSAEGHAILRSRVTLLHCTTEYPAPFASVNLRAMETLRTAFGLKVGYSDHTRGTAIAIAAAALGATTIEKHFTTDRTLEGPDHAASLEPAELKAMIAAIREVTTALGHGRKLPTDAELPNIAVARRSLVARTAIRAGEAFTEANLTAKRPGTGISAIAYDEWIGRPATRDYEPDDLI